MSTQHNPRFKAELRRNQALGKIHIGKKQLGMDDETYRAMLLTIGGVKSSKDLSPEGMDKVVRHLEKAGAVFTRPKKSGRKPHNLPSGSDRAPKMSKIEALLAHMGLPWDYAVGIARQQCKKKTLEFCSHDELTAIIVALEKRAQKIAEKSANAAQ